MLHNEEEWLPYLDSIFSGLDKDGDGSISLTELVEFIPPTAANVSEHGNWEFRFSFSSLGNAWQI